MRTAVVIATHRRRPLIERLLATLAAAALPDGVQIVVVENGIPCGVDALCRENPLGERIRYLYQPVGNKALALNHAVAETRADFVIFLDDDVTPAPDIVGIYVDAARRWGPSHFFGGGLVADAETDCPDHLLPYLPRSARGWAFADAETEIPRPDFDFFFGANWAAFRSDLSQAGLFAPELGISQSKYSSVGEETELQQRMIQAGGKAIYLPGATVLHPVPAECYTAPWLRRRRFRLGVAEWLTTHGGPGRPLPRFCMPPWVLRSVLVRKLQGVQLALARAPIAALTENAMEQAHLVGLLYGAWLDCREAVMGRRVTARRRASAPRSIG